jgi:hypothetical protein
MKTVQETFSYNLPVGNYPCVNGEIEVVEGGESYVSISYLSDCHNCRHFIGDLNKTCEPNPYYNSETYCDKFTPK